MAYYEYEELKNMGFKALGREVKVSTKASIYDVGQIEIGDFSRIDDFCILSGRVVIGRNVHVAPFCLVAGGEKGIVLEDFAGLAYGVQVFAQSDDYSGRTLTNPTVPDKYKKEAKKEVVIKKHSIVGAGSIIMYGVTLEEGTAVGAMSLVRESTEPWGIYLGNPARRIMSRRKELLQLEKAYVQEEGSVGDSVQ